MVTTSLPVIFNEETLKFEMCEKDVEVRRNLVTLLKTIREVLHEVCTQLEAVVNKEYRILYS